MSDTPTRYHFGIEEPVLPVVAVMLIPAILMFAVAIGAACQLGWLS